MDKRFNTLDEVVAEAMSTIKQATEEEKLYMKQWAYRALKEIGPSQWNIDVATLYPEDLTIRKPDDFYKAIDIGLFNGNDQELAYKFRSGKEQIHQDPNVYSENGIYVPQFDAVIKLSEDENFYYMSSNADNVNYAKLRYFKMPLDDEGNLKFPDFTVEACVSYIHYNWARREQSPNIGLNLQIWKDARAEARGKGKLPHGIQYKQLAAEFNSMIQKFNPYRY